MTRLALTILITVFLTACTSHRMGASEERPAQYLNIRVRSETGPERPGVFFEPRMASGITEISIHVEQSVTPESLLSFSRLVVIEKASGDVAPFKGINVHVSYVTNPMVTVTDANFSEYFSRVNLLDFYVLEPGKTYLIWWPYFRGVPGSNIAEFHYQVLGNYGIPWGVNEKDIQKVWKLVQNGTIGE